MTAAQRRVLIVAAATVLAMFGAGALLYVATRPEPTSCILEPCIEGLP